MTNLSLSQRLALMFAAISLVTLGTIGFLLYGSLAKELAWRDDQTLLGRLERMEALLTNTRTIAELESQPQLYANMLGNTENVLWVMNADGEVLIEINPPNIPVPPPARNAGAEFFTHSDPVAFRAVRMNTTIDGQSLTLIAGRTLAERNQMLAGYRATLWWAVTVGTLICALLGWLISQRALAPVRQISETLSQIRTNSLDVRLDVTDPAPEIRQLQNRLNGMIERLETGFEQLSRFSEDLAHEMRTPLHTLIGQTQQSLSQPRSKEEYEALLLSNLEEHERLSRVINSMLFLARTEHSEAPAAAQALELPPLVDQLFDYFADIAADAQITLINETSGQLMASRDMVQRALANLMDNALRYGTRPGALRVRSWREGSRQYLSVFNTGEAIPENHLPRLFDRFYRCDAARQTVSETGGLGLAIVASIVKHHGGSASVKNVERGVEFTLEFPS